ncbi:MAG: chemosensory pili system protein ChpA (sensor histidine kinase/response regulator) [Parasphingorhabdus sp.]|jgi:chemosensory pili system protein ChpA (sensor histidine kinase/response regulator)
MSTLPTIDSGTLGWVKSEIEDTATQAKGALDNYTDNTQDLSAIRMCATHLHQIHGTLSMVELDGLARLVQESENLVLKVSDGGMLWSGDIHNVLKRSIDDVSNYLEALQNPPIPSPLQLVPAINNLRGVQNEPSISEFELFSPDLSSRPPDASKRAKLGPEMFVKLVDDLRSRFERSLLAWLRDSQDRAAIQDFGKVFSNLIGIERRGSLRQLWWIASGLSEAMLDGAHQPNDETRLIFARLNEQLKLIKEKSQTGSRHAPPDELIKRILLVLAYSPSSSKIVEKIKTSFSLDAWVSSANDLGLPSVEQMAKSMVTFGIEADTELNSAQNLLARYFSPQGYSGEVLDRLGSRLEALKIAAQRNELKAVEDLLEATRGIVSGLRRGSITNLDQVSLQMAGALLFIQDSASGQIRPGVEWRHQAESTIQELVKISSSDSSELDVQASGPVNLASGGGGQEVTRAAATEVRSELQYVEHNLERVASKHASVSTLRSVDGHLKRVEGTLEILEQADGAILAEKLREFVSSVVEQGVDPSNRSLDAMAMAVGTLSAVADSLGQSGGIQVLGSAIERAIRELSTSTSHETIKLEDSSSAGKFELDVDADRAPVSSNLSQKHSPLKTSFAVTREVLEIDFPEQPESEPVVNLPLDQSGSHIDTSAVDDDEFVAMFFEEATEVGEQLEKYAGKWLNESVDNATLKDLRRCFHTLKGSGRFVQAKAVSELSWYVEELLTDYLEEGLTPDEEVRKFVFSAWQELKSYIATANPEHPAELIHWKRQAEQLTRSRSDQKSAFEQSTEVSVGEEFSSIQKQREWRSDTPPPLPEVTFAQSSPMPADAGDDVNSVFRLEMEGHISLISSAVADARASMGEWTITEDLLRTTHTLKGVLRSVGLTSMAESANALDSLLGFSNEHGARLEEVDLVLLDQCGRLFRFAMNKLDDANRLPTDMALQFDELAVAMGERLRFVKGDEPKFSPSEISVTKSVTKDVTAIDIPAYHPAIDEDDELLEAFKEEAAEILDRFDSSVQQIEKNGISTAILSSLRRELHTFKGGARAIGWTLLGDLGHNTETLLENNELVQNADTSLVSLLQEFRDLSSVVVSSSQQLMADDIDRLNIKVLSFDGSGTSEAMSPLFDAVVDAELLPAVTPSLSLSENQRADLSVGGGAEVRAVRVSTEVLDELVNYAGEVSILRSRLQQQISMVKSNLGELSGNVRLFRDQLRDLEIEAESQMIATSEQFREDNNAIDFDPLEMDRFSRLQTLARGLSDNLNDLIAIQAGLTEFAGDAENTLQQQSHISDGLQEGLLRTRMVAFASIVPRLRHLSRQTGRDLGRSAALTIHGELVEIDRKVLDQISVAFEHMIRNAIAHGIEGAEERVAAGKPVEGRLRINMEQDGNDILIEFSDDGRGVNRTAIEQKARASGILLPGQELSDDELMVVLATPGLSTASELTQVSGRGVGMDVVSEMVRQLGGSITVHSVSGKNTTFRMRLPVTLAISHALLVYAGEQMFALPARLIFNVLRVPVADLLPGNKDADAQMLYNDKKIPLLNLANRLGLPFSDKDKRTASVIVVRAGLREIGLRVESVSDTREVVVKPLGKQLQNIPGFGSVTLLGDGSIVLILDVGDLWQNRQISVQADEYRAVSSSSSENKTVMVVDDSLTVRNVMGRDLQNNGFEVILAKDGVDALEQLRHAIPDIMLVDLEMPRMDGFELTRRLRADDNLSAIPILIITSRSGSRHRDQALANGATGYMTKPYRLDDLVANITELTTTESHGLAGDPTLQLELNS